MDKKYTADGIVTFSGRLVRPLSPDWREIDIEDIAHALSNQCRFTGHTRCFYSVAQHSCLVSDNCPPHLKLDGLLHDASEAYLSDIARPIKLQPGLGEVYKKVEDRLMEAITDKFGLEWPIPKEVKAADNMLLKTEIRDLMPGSEDFSVDGGDVEAILGKIKTWSPSKAKQEFLARFTDLHG